MDEEQLIKAHYDTIAQNIAERFCSAEELLAIEQAPPNIEFEAALHRLNTNQATPFLAIPPLDTKAERFALVSHFDTLDASGQSFHALFPDVALCRQLSTEDIYVPESLFLTKIVNEQEFTALKIWSSAQSSVSHALKEMQTFCNTRLLVNGVDEVAVHPFLKQIAMHQFFPEHQKINASLLKTSHLMKQNQTYPPKRINLIHLNSLQLILQGKLNGVMSLLSQHSSHAFDFNQWTIDVYNKTHFKSYNLSCWLQVIKWSYDVVNLPEEFQVVAEEFIATMKLIDKDVHSSSLSDSYFEVLEQEEAIPDPLLDKIEKRAEALTAYLQDF